MEKKRGYTMDFTFNKSRYFKDFFKKNYAIGGFYAPPSHKNTEQHVEQVHTLQTFTS